MAKLEIKIFHDELEVGSVWQDTTEGTLALAYAEAWAKHGFVLSPALPFDKPSAPGALKRFIENLFPEGSSMDELLEWYRLSRQYTLRILERTGQETTGAFRFSSSGLAAPETSFRELSASELIERLDRRSQEGLVIWDGKPRLSVAGVQGKLPVLVLPDGRFGFGEGKLASNRILKFQALSDRLPHLVLNEFLCMKLARALGLSVADVTWQRFGAHPVLSVERFDRVWRDQQVLRRHVIDGCQALDLPAAHKYERNLGSGRDVAHVREGASVQRLVAFTNQCQTPAKALLDLIDGLIFNLIIGNEDAHGKNISYFLGCSGVTPAPAYDMVNTTMYPRIEHGLAMAIGDEFELANIGAFELSNFCEENGVPRRLLAQRLKLQLKRLPGSLEGLPLPPELASEERQFAEELKENVLARNRSLLNAANELGKM